MKEASYSEVHSYKLVREAVVVGKCGTENKRGFGGGGGRRQDLQK